MTSAGLFRSKQFKSKKNLKHISISTPIINEDNVQDNTTPRRIDTPSFIAPSLKSPQIRSPKPVKLQGSSRCASFQPPPPFSVPYGGGSPNLDNKDYLPVSHSSGSINKIHSSRSSSFDLNSGKSYRSKTDSSITPNPTSKPTNLGVVVLMAKYDFVAETREELSINVNEYLRLIERPGDGWLKVKNIQTNRLGLIPASYVKISVNDLINPITSDWLNEIVPLEVDTSCSSDDMFDFEKPHTSDDSNNSLNVANMVEKHPYPKSISINHVLQYKEKFWYRLDVKMSNGDKIFVGKFYKDIYDLHVTLSLLNFKNLPILPQPIKKSNNGKKHFENLLIRCNELNVYVNKLIKLPEYQNSKQLYDWIMYEKSRKLENPSQTIDEFINEKLFPGSINISDLIQPTASSQKNFSPTAPLPPLENMNISGKISRSSSFQTSPVTSITTSFGSNQRDREHSASTINSSENDSIFSKSPKTPQANNSGMFNNDDLLTPVTPISPQLPEVDSSPMINPLNNQFVKIKIALNNEENDMVVLKVKNTRIHSLDYLKKLISFKIYKDYQLTNHYKLSLTDKSLSDEDLLTYIKSNPKVSLKLVRVRGV